MVNIKKTVRNDLNNMLAKKTSSILVLHHPGSITSGNFQTCPRVYALKEKIKRPGECWFSLQDKVIVLVKQWPLDVTNARAGDGIFQVVSGPLQFRGLLCPWIQRTFTIDTTLTNSSELSSLVVLWPSRWASNMMCPILRLCLVFLGSFSDGDWLYMHHRSNPKVQDSNQVIDPNNTSEWI